MEQFYVSVSRAKKELRIFTDDKRALLDAVSRREDRITATELLRGHARDRDRRRHSMEKHLPAPAPRYARDQDHPHRAPQRYQPELTHDR